MQITMRITGLTTVELRRLAALGVVGAVTLDGPEKFTVETAKMDAAKAGAAVHAVDPTPATDPALTPPGHNCTRCGQTVDECESGVQRTGIACCSACAVRETHGMTSDDWAEITKRLRLDRS